MPGDLWGPILKIELFTFPTHLTHHSRLGTSFLLVVSCLQHSIATNVGGIFKFGMLNLHVLKIKITQKMI